jgi:hypothetical protein
VALLDATWQGRPEWTDDSSWVTVDAPDLVYEGPPYPGLLLKANVPADGELRVLCGHDSPGRPFECVCRTELMVGDHGFVVETDGGHLPVPLPCGNYDVEVWVQAADALRAEAVAFIFGSQRPRSLGVLRTT